MASHASSGCMAPPVSMAVARRRFLSSSVVHATPPIRSWWPPMYLVAEWITTSKPSSAGVHRYGEANVLSTTAVTPAVRHRSARAARSATVTLGLAMVSTWNSFAPGRGPATVYRPCGEAALPALGHRSGPPLGVTGAEVSDQPGQLVHDLVGDLPDDPGVVGLVGVRREVQGHAGLEPDGPAELAGVEPVL